MDKALTSGASSSSWEIKERKMRHWLFGGLVTVPPPQNEAQDSGFNV